MQAAQLRWIRWGTLGLVLLVLGIVGFFWFGPGKVTAASFEPRGDSLVMRGVITKSTPQALKEAREEFPGLTRIIMAFVPGSVDDVANLEAARMVRAAGLTTVIPADGVVASGGTDFFLAGRERIVRIGACIGVHAWSGGLGTKPENLSRTHEAHRMYLDYYASIGINPAFYWYTIDAAPSTSIHWMTDREMRHYAVATSYQTAQISRVSGCDDRL
ncbi:alpha/beta hydrolase [Alphaproteobacteria bacterium]|jgi:hypothetical protein|nr:alpha/beta hydrolase [Alphaproteobacteria bacterium]MDA8602852.1 alpha/beta hydrolase [Alphaproteobacteria bacterium]